jgi:hypothetical protein
MKVGIISPQDWGLAVADTDSRELIPGLDISPYDLEQRIHQCTYQWAQRHFDDKAGAFYGFYSAPVKRFERPQTVNLIAPWQFLAAYDHYQDDDLLAKASRATDWFYRESASDGPLDQVRR